jgi:hypothetical protein
MWERKQLFVGLLRSRRGMRTTATMMITSTAMKQQLTILPAQLVNPYVKSGATGSIVGQCLRCPTLLLL